MSLTFSCNFGEILSWLYMQQIMVFSSSTLCQASKSAARQLGAVCSTCQHGFAKSFVKMNGYAKNDVCPRHCNTHCGITILWARPSFSHDHANKIQYAPVEINPAAG